MAKHSPGPWRKYSGKLRPQFRTRIHEITDVRGEVVVKWPGFDGLDIPNAEIIANVRLLTTAPRLLAACEAALPFIDEMAAAGNAHAPRVRDQVKKAIAAAKGKASSAVEHGGRDG